FDRARESAIRGRNQEALAGLAAAVDAGWGDLDVTRRERAFEELRRSEGFRSLLRRLEQRCDYLELIPPRAVEPSPASGLGTFLRLSAAKEESTKGGPHEIGSIRPWHHHPGRPGGDGARRRVPGQPDGGHDGDRTPGHDPLPGDDG